MAARREAAVTGNEEGGSGARERGHRRERATRWLRRWGSAAAPVMGIYCSSGDGDPRRLRPWISICGAPERRGVKKRKRAED